MKAQKNELNNLIAKINDLIVSENTHQKCTHCEGFDCRIRTCYVCDGQHVEPNTEGEALLRLRKQIGEHFRVNPISKYYHDMHK